MTRQLWPRKSQLAGHQKEFEAKDSDVNAILEKVGLFEEEVIARTLKKRKCVDADGNKEEANDGKPESE
eukprot:8991512-Pyramimonas_sp.AAC.1